jgi:hypothetical protein
MTTRLERYARSRVCNLVVGYVHWEREERLRAEKPELVVGAKHAEAAA